MKDLHKEFESYPDATPEDFDNFKDAPEKESLATNAEDFGRGAINLGGLAPVVTGAGEATIDKLKAAWNGDKAADWLDSYRKHQQESQANFDKSKKRSPWLYGGGQLAGALGLGALTAGAGLGVGGAAAAEGVDALGAAGAGEAAGTGLLRLLGTSAAEGAGLGGVSGAAESEGNLDTAEGRSKMLSDAAHGAAAGAVVAPAIAGAGAVVSPLLSKAAGKVGDYASGLAEDSPVLRQTLDAYKKGRNGVALNAGNESKAMMGEQNQSAVEDITNRFLGARNTLSQEKRALIENASTDGAQVRLPDEMLENLSNFQEVLASNPNSKSEEAKSVMATLQKLKIGGKPAESGLLDAQGNPLASTISNNSLTPAEAMDLRAKMLDLSSSDQSGALKRIANKFGHDLEAPLEEAVPGWKNVNSQFRDLSAGTTDKILGKGLSDDLNNKYTSEMTDKEGKLAGAVKNLLSSSEAPGAKSAESSSTINRVIDELRDLETKYPGITEKVGLNPDILKQDFQTAGDNFAQTRAVLGGTSESGNKAATSIWGLAGGANTGRGQLINKANLLGRGVKAASDSTIASMGRSVYALPDEALGNLSDKLKQTPGLSSLGDALDKAVRNKNESLKNAALFSIMQNPNARHMISGGDDDSQPMPQKP